MQRYEQRFTAMGGPCLIRLDTADESKALEALEAAETEVRRLDNKYSRYQPNSIVSKINTSANTGESIALDEETACLLNYAETLWQQSEGEFDITLGVLRRAWNFKSKELPEQSTIEALMPLIGWRQVDWNHESIRLPRPGMEMDLGGIVKEYAGDCVRTVLQDQGVQFGLIDLAGDMTIVGPQANNDRWSIGIRHPHFTQRALADIELNRGALASSGDYERCMNVNGKRYGHILSPKTGWPVQGLVAVSAVADQCLVAGSICTLAMLKQPQAALEWLSKTGVPWLAVDSHQQVYGTIAAN